MNDTERTARRHLTPELLDDWFVGDASLLDVLRRGLRHLEARGVPRAEPAGRAAAKSLVRLVEESLRLDFEDAQHQVAGVRELARGLQGLGEVETLAAVAADRRFQNLPLVYSLLEVATDSLEARHTEGAERSLELAEAALRGVDAARYGSPLVAGAHARLLTLRAFHALSAGDVVRAEGWLKELQGKLAGKWLWEEARAGYEVAAAALRLARGDREGTRLAFETAASLFGDPLLVDDHWRSWAEAGAAWLERSAGYPWAAVLRLRAYFEDVRPALVCRGELWAARELVLSLRDSGAELEARERVRGWEALEPHEPFRVAELTYLRAVLAPPEKAVELLEEAYRQHLALDSGADAALVALDVVRLLESSTGGALYDLARRLPDLALYDDLPRAALAALARFVGGEDPEAARAEAMDRLEVLLLQSRAGWGPGPEGHDAA